MRIIGYERVSTARQGASGLGLEAQRQAIEAYATQRGATLIARFTEVESGRNADRPELKQALHLAKVTGATLVIAKLDRLSRNAAFLLTLRDSGVRFSAVDLPEANDLTVGIMALVAQQEREAISRRTKEALAIARSRGVKLGNPNGAAAFRRAGKGGAALREATRPQRRPARAGPGAGGGGHPGGWSREPAGDRGGAERARHAHPARRALACLDGDEPARPAGDAGGGMQRRSGGDWRMTFVVRLLEDGDQGLLARVAPEVFDHAVDPLLADAFLRDPRHHLVAAIAHDRLVGFISALDYWHPDKPRELWINEVGVAPVWQHRGVGTRLLQQTLEHARALDCVSAWVLTEHDNARALGLYRKLGGVQSGTDVVMFTFELTGDA